MASFYQGIFYLNVLLNVVYLSWAQDPYRWVPSYGKPAVQSSTDGSHVASYATDGDYNFYTLPVNYSSTTVSDNPYLQVDLGETVVIDRISLKFPVLQDPVNIYKKIRVSVGTSSSITDPSTITCNGDYDRNGGYNLIDCNTRARYVFVQSVTTSTVLSLCEVAVNNRPVESLAYGKAATQSSVYQNSDQAGKAVNMVFIDRYHSGQEDNPWMRIDLADIYFVHEVVVFGREWCCDELLDNINVMAGTSLANNGNSNKLCGKLFFESFAERRSIYCDVRAQYINLFREVVFHFFHLTEVIVNPETTENVAAHSIETNSIVEFLPDNPPRFLTDNYLPYCHIMKESFVKKKVWIKMWRSALIYKVYIANNPERLNELTDFDIKIGPTADDSTLCLPGLQDMSGRLTASFVCEPSRISGQYIVITQHREEKQMSICEIAAFEETKPMIDREMGHHVWAEESKDTAITCDVKGYPAPAVTWKKDDKIIQNNTLTLQLTSASRNASGQHQLWTENIHGIDFMAIDLVVSSHLRVCAEFDELNYVIGKSDEYELKMKGHKWYSIFDQKAIKHLQFRESSPTSLPSCNVWLNGQHPKLNDGVLSTELCVKTKTNDCLRTVEVYVRRCAGHYIYNFKNLMSSHGLTFCLVDSKDMHKDIPAMMASPVTNHAVTDGVFQTEVEVAQAYQCLIMCQIDARCKSFNFSRKLKICELNTSTKKTTPKKYQSHMNYDYYEMIGGTVVSAKQDL